MESEFAGIPYKWQRLFFLLQLSLVAAITGILALQQLQFKNTWSRSCDYNQKIFSTVWVSRALLQWVLISLLSVLQSGLLVSLIHGFLNLLGVFKLCWFFYGIVPTFVEDHCDPQVSGTWCLVLWYLELGLMLAPIALLCIAIPIVACCGMQGKGFGNIPEGIPLPEDVRNELNPMMYNEIKSNEGPTYPDISSTLVGLPLPGMGQSTNTCGLCSTAFTPDASVIQLQCQSRHVFHSNCLFKWFDRSQCCPTCSTNISTKRQATTAETPQDPGKQKQPVGQEKAELLESV